VCCEILLHFVDSFKSLALIHRLKFFLSDNSSVIDAQVASLANFARIHFPIRVRAFRCQFLSSLRMITVTTKSVSIEFGIRMLTVSYQCLRLGLLNEFNFDRTFFFDCRGRPLCLSHFANRFDYNCARQRLLMNMITYLGWVLLKRPRSLLAQCSFSGGTALRSRFVFRTGCSFHDSHENSLTQKLFLGDDIVVL
jgi:hypothetical protein